MLFYLKLFARRIIKDFKHKELLPLKLLFFIHASSEYLSNKNIVKNPEQNRNL